MKINDKYTVNIIDEDNIGNGIAKLNNFVIFVKNALLDEEVNVEIKDIKKNYATATIDRIIKPSNKREEVKCKFYDLCGGCNFLHTSYSNEKDIKLKYFEKLFNKKINYLEVKNIYNYRNKVVLHVNNSKLGYFNDKTHTLCEIDNCDLLNPKISLKIAEIKKYDLSHIREIMIRCINDEIMINITSLKDDFDIKNIECESLYINNKYIKGKEYLIDEINNLKFTIYPESFYQINKEGMKLIYNKALEYAGSGNNLLDLYCGTGTIGMWMHNNFKNITGIEINESSIKNANINKELNNIKNIKFICNDAKNVKGSFDTIVVDPPRSGLFKDVITFLNNSKANKIIYISCNPNTLKRDIDLLNKYELRDISYTDMFPRTKHVECVTLLCRKTL